MYATVMQSLGEKTERRQRQNAADGRLPRYMEETERRRHVGMRQPAAASEGRWTDRGGTAVRCPDDGAEAEAVRVDRQLEKS